MDQFDQVNVRTWTLPAQSHVHLRHPQNSGPPLGCPILRVEEDAGLVRVHPLSHWQNACLIFICVLVSAWD